MFLLPLTFIVKRINPWPGPSSLRVHANTRAACSSAGLEASRLWPSPTAPSAFQFWLRTRQVFDLQRWIRHFVKSIFCLVILYNIYCNNVRRGLHRACTIRVHVARTRTRVQALLLIRRSSLISAYSLPVEI